jgi:hypothetical protein
MFVGAYRASRANGLRLETSRRHAKGTIVARSLFPGGRSTTQLSASPSSVVVSPPPARLVCGIQLASPAGMRYPRYVGSALLLTALACGGSDGLEIQDAPSGRNLIRRRPAPAVATRRSLRQHERSASRAMRRCTPDLGRRVTSHSQVAISSATVHQTVATPVWVMSK